MNRKEVFMAEIVENAPERGDGCVRWGWKPTQAFPIEDKDKEWLDEEHAKEDREKTCQKY